MSFQMDRRKLIFAAFMIIASLTSMAQKQYGWLELPGYLKSEWEWTLLVLLMMMSFQ